MTSFSVICYQLCRKYNHYKTLAGENFDEKVRIRLSDNNIY